MSRIAANWAAKNLTGMSSYTFSVLPEWIQEIGQTALRRVVIGYIRDWTRAQQPLEKIVDLGCGVGDWTVEYLSFAEQVVGVDVNPQFLQHAMLLARSRSNGEQLRLVRDNVTGYSDFEDSELVCMGGCIQYLNMEEVGGLFHKLQRALPAGAKAYVRTTITNDLRGAYQTEGAYYRKREFYDNLFAESGFDIVRSCSSRRLVLQRLSFDLLGQGERHGLETLVCGVEAGFRARKAVSRQNEYWNWFLVRRDAG